MERKGAQTSESQAMHVLIAQDFSAVSPGAILNSVTPMKISAPVPILTWQ